MKRTILYLTVAVALFSLSCKKEPTGTISTDKTSPAVGDTVTVTMTALENYSCVQWAMIVNSESNSPTVISGGEAGDLSVSVTFPAAGTYQIDATAKNCKSSDYEDGDDCFCEKNHTSETFSVDIAVQ